MTQFKSIQINSNLAPFSLRNMSCCGNVDTRSKVSTTSWSLMPMPWLLERPSLYQCDSEGSADFKILDHLRLILTLYIYILDKFNIWLSVCPKRGCLARCCRTKCSCADLYRLLVRSGTHACNWPVVGRRNLQKRWLRTEEPPAADKQFLGQNRNCIVYKKKPSITQMP